MAKRSRTKARDVAAPEGEVGPRQPCPCGSGKRYKACHGAPGGAGDVYVGRPFEGLPSECDIVALRELVPAATAPLTVKDTDRTVQLCTLLPMAAPAMVRDNGDVWLGLQVQHHFGDPSRDLAAVLTRALDAEPGEGSSGSPTRPAPARACRTWSPNDRSTSPSTRASSTGSRTSTTATADALVEQANSSVTPTSRLASVEAAYWTNVGSKEHLRWVMPEPEDRLLDALARLHAAGKDSLVPDSRLVGMFRAHGLLAPVWDLEVGTGAEVLEEPAARFAADLAEALADESDLTTEQRAARSGLANRQVTIR